MNRVEQRNITLNAVGEGLWGTGTSLVLPAVVLAILLREHGAGTVMIGAVTSIEIGGIALLQLLGPYLLTSRRNRKRNLLLWHALLPIPFGVLMGVVAFFAERLGDPATRWSLLICYAGQVVSIGIIVAVWSDWIAHLFETRIRGRAYGLALCASALGGGAALALSGALIRHYGPAVFPFLYWSSALLCILSMAVFWHVRDPAEQEEEQSLRLDFSTMMVRFRDSLRSANFRAFLVGRLLATGGFSFIPILAVHFMSVQGGSLRQGAVVGYGVALPLGAGISNVLIGRRSDAKGHKQGMLVGIGMQITALLLLLSGSGAANCIQVYACTGMAMGIGMVSHYNLLFETCPHDSRLAHITVGNLVFSAGTVTAPLLAGWVAATHGTATLFGGSLLLSVLALAWFMLFVKEPRHLVIQ